jgi:hypothetical protein
MNRQVKGEGQGRTTYNPYQLVTGNAISWGIAAGWKLELGLV